MQSKDVIQMLLIDKYRYHKEIITFLNRIQTLVKSLDW